MRAKPCKVTENLIILLTYRIAFLFVLIYDIELLALVLKTQIPPIFAHENK
jgi:hypothetical protein